MGSETAVTVRFKGQTAAGKARLETEVLHFRGGDLKLSIPFKQMSNVAARSGTLKVTFPGGIAAFDLRQAAAKWADKILHPPSRLQKIGVKPDWRACAIGVDDEEFLQELDAAIADLSIGRIVKDCDAIFSGVAKESELARLPHLSRITAPARRAAGSGERRSAARDRQSAIHAR